MKMLPAWISIALLMVCTLPAALGSMNLISTVLSTHGDWREVWVIGDDQAGEFHRSAGTFNTSTNGVGAISSIEAFSPQRWEYAASSIRAFGLDMGSQSMYGAGPITNGIAGLPGQEINIYSIATTRLNFVGTRLSVNIRGLASYNYDDWEQDMQVVLRNVTSGIILLDVSNLDRYSDIPFAHDYLYNVNRLDEYEFVLSGRINSSDGKLADMNASVTMFSVCDSGSTLALFALACLGMLRPFRSKRRNA